jgi:hypothetical protein
MPESSHVPGYPLTKGDVRIGNDVWLGLGAWVLSGVTIGDGAIVGARAVVATDVPPYSVVVGNPARVVRQRYPPQVIERLLEIAWWNWPRDRILEAVPLLMSGSVDEFLEHASARGERVGVRGVPAAHG